jgi:hypothetical protein
MSNSARRLRLIAAVVIVLFGLLYAGDWLVWRWRVTHGTAYGTIEVHQFLATSLKGNKTEYDVTGSFQETCSRSIFQQQGNPACWWLARHNTQWE